MLNAEQAMALEVLADALLDLGSAMRGCANAFASPAESFPAVVEAAAVAAPPPEGWTSELICRYAAEPYRNIETMPHWMRKPPSGYKWFQDWLDKESVAYLMAVAA